MNALSMPFRQLVDRKLWPLAILLIAALAAVPVLLSKDEAAPLPPAGLSANAAQTADASETQPIVSLGEPAERESRRKVLGARKDPFEPKVKAKKAATPATTSTAGTSTGASTKPSGGSSTPSGAPLVGVNPGVTAPQVKKKTYELYSLKIRFGSTASEDLANRSIKRLTALPKMAEPVLVYLGLKKDLRTAVFLVDAGTTVVGDGKCLPTPANCQNLELKRGQTAFIDVLDENSESTVAQYQLDFVKVLRKRTSDARAAKASRRAVAKGGRNALRANISRVNGWDYDPETGVLVSRDE